jgi:eukaryotic translation initiation factor 2C
MRKVKVSTRYLGYKRIMTIQRVVTNSASKQTFQCAELGGVISVKDYYVKSAFINLPLIRHLHPRRV